MVFAPRKEHSDFARGSGRGRGRGRGRGAKASTSRHPMSDSHDMNRDPLTDTAPWPAVTTQILNDTKGTFRFANLPQVLREEVYDYVFHNQTVCIRYDPRMLKQSRECSGWSLAIAQTCRTLRPEALSRFYRTVKFDLKNFGEFWERYEREVQDAKASSNRSRKAYLTQAQDHQIIVNNVLKRVRRVILRPEDLPLFGLDVRYWTWDSRLDQRLPKLRELYVDAGLFICSCDWWSLADSFDYDTGFPLAWRGHVHGRRSSGEIGHSDGEFMRQVVESACRDFPLHMSVDLYDGCTAFGITRFTIDRDMKFELHEFFNYYSSNGALVNFLNGFGFHEKAQEMQKMIDDNKDSEIDA